MWVGGGGGLHFRHYTQYTWTTAADSGMSIIVLRIHQTQQEFDHFKVACKYQGRITIIVFQVHIRTILHQ